MPDKCIHGFDPAECLICRTLAAPARPESAAEQPKGWRGRRTTPASPTDASPLRPDAVYSPRRLSAGSAGRGHGVARPLTIAVVVVLAVAASVWILAGLVFTVLHLLELIVVAGGAGWVGYRIGHFNGSRHARPER